MIDLHAHILPDIDDGPASLEESIELCRAAEEDGIDTIVATPHAFHGLYHATRGAIFNRVAALRDRLDAAGVAIAIEPGAEISLTADLVDRIEKGEAMTLADGGKYILLELPNNILPRGIDDLLFSLRLEGMKAIISHPERNFAVRDDVDALSAIADSGHLVQLTAASLTGYFGEETYRCAVKLLESGLCHVVASDCHSLDGRPPGLSEARHRVRALAGEAEAERIFEHNPARILAGGDLEPLEERAAAPARSSTSKLMNWIRRIR